MRTSRLALWGALLFSTFLTGQITPAAENPLPPSDSVPRIYSLEFKGLEKTKRSFLEKIIGVEAGEILDSARLEEDVQMLIRLPSVAHAYFQVFQSHDNFYRVIYNIEENFTLLPDLNIYTRGDQIWWRVGAGEYNLLGRNIFVGAFYRNNGKHSYGVNFRAPFLFGKRWGLAASFNDFTSDEPVYFENNNVGIYEYKNRALELLGLFQWDFHNRLEFGGSFFKEQYTYLRGAENVDARPDLISQNKWLLKVTHQYYRVNQYFQYLDGMINTANIQTVLTEGEENPIFNIAFNDFIIYKRWHQKANFATRLRLGISTNNNTPFSAFVVDNQMNIRGVGDRVDRGSGVITLNTEYRYTLWENDWAAFQGVAFVDYGSWREPAGGLDDFVEKENVYLHSGGGLRFILKKVYNATFRIDYGIGLTPTNNSRGFVLGLGQYF